MASNSRQNKQKNIEYEKTKNQFSLKEKVENEDLYKSVLNKIMTTHEQWIKCNCYDYRANNNAVTWQTEKNFIILYSKKYTLKKYILINTSAFCRMLPS